MTDQQPPSWRFTAAPVDPDAERTALARVAEHEAASTKAAEWLAKHSQQPAAEQLLNLADRAERAALTADEAARLREGINQLYAELAALKSIGRSYCPECGRGDCSPTADQWYQQQQRAERAEAAIERVTSLVRHYEQWGATGWQPYSAKPSQVAREFRAALNEHQEQPPS